MKFLFLIILSLPFCSPGRSQLIQVPESIEIALGSDFGKYTTQIEAACSGSNEALLSVLKIDFIFDGAGYDHGVVLIELLNHTGDDKFISTVHLLTESEKTTLRNYIEVGLDRYAVEKYRTIFSEHRRVFTELKIKE
jgi:hypothetical protein